MNNEPEVLISILTKQSNGQPWAYIHQQLVTPYWHANPHTIYLYSKHDTNDTGRDGQS